MNSVADPRAYSLLPNGPVPKGGAEEVGNKAWNLMQIGRAGVAVPPGFVLPTYWCRSYRAGQLDNAALSEVLTSGIALIENAARLEFGSCRQPLLVSVRSGAAVSMPGMMETVLNIGANATTVEGLIRLTGNPRLAWDCYRRLIQGYAGVVLDLPSGPFDELIAKAVSDAEADAESELDFRALRELTHQMLHRAAENSASQVPDDPYQQLSHAVLAVFRSWDSPKAASYRKLNGISDDLGTAVTVQRMVFGNAGGASGSGIGFTRNPATGDRELYLDFQFNSQGEDVVAGRHAVRDSERLRRQLPAIWKELESTAHALETHFRDAQDFEFTVESGALYILQSRNAKRTDWAALHIATDLVKEGFISPPEALTRLATLDLASVSRTRLATTQEQPLARAQVASMGVATGKIALETETAKSLAAAGHPVILVRRDTATSDIEGMSVAAGILTAMGGRTSHAAVVARQLGKVCLVGCPDLVIEMDRRACRIGDRTFREGDSISLDANTGDIYAGSLETITEHPEKELGVIRSWQQTLSAIS